MAQPSFTDAQDAINRLPGFAGVALRDVNAVRSSDG
jgi:hypothetical protein